MLAAGFYLQQLASDDSFATGDANKRLAEHGIKIGNASQCVRQSLAAAGLRGHPRPLPRLAAGPAYLRQLTNGAYRSEEGCGEAAPPHAPPFLWVVPVMNRRRSHPLRLEGNGGARGGATSPHFLSSRLTLLPGGLLELS
jgi:hypothetical protein